MAAASPSPLAASTETTNGVKLRRLLVDGGTTALRKVFDGIHPPTNLAANLHLNNSTLDDLFARGILTEEQRNLLFPTNGSKPDSKTFDITLLFLLLTEISDLSPPARTGWNHKPHAKNRSLPANLVRIKLFRNKLLHTPETRIDSRLFNELWKEISGVLVSLGLDQAEINRLKTEHCGEEDYLKVLFQWADREKEINARLKEVSQSQTTMLKAVETVGQTQQEHLTLLQDANAKLEQAHKTQQGTKSKLDTIHQGQAKTPEILESVQQTQLEDHEDHETLQGNKSKLNEVHQTQTKTHETVEKVRQIQLEDHQTLQDNKSKMDKVHQIQTKTQATVEKVRQTQLKDSETLSKSVEEVKEAVNSLKEGRDKDRSEEVLSNLAKSEFKGDIEYFVGRYQEGTREWVFNEVENWLDDRNSQNRVMVISSNAGMGKSVIAAVICKRMQEAGRLSGSHFCQHNNVRYRNPQLMLQSLACHSCHALPEYKQALVKQLSRNLGKDLNNMGAEELFALLFKEPLSTVADPGRNMLMVIDGLDESEYQERNELLDVLANHLSKLPCWIRFLCTTRPEKNIAEALKHLKPFQLEPNDDKNMEDIKHFIENRTEHLIKPEKKAAIVEKLLKKSEGLMLYAYFLVLFIEENKSVLDQGDLADSLPLAISSAYCSYFKRLEKELKKEVGVNEEDFLKLLSALIASREPMPIDFVSKLLGLNASSPSARRKVRKAISSVSSLLPIRDDCLHVIHKSVKDWLTDTSCYKEHDFTVDERDGHCRLASLCADELDDLKRKGVREAPLSPTEKYALFHGVRHMLQLEENVRTPSVDECVQTYLTDLEVLYAEFSVNNSKAAEDILWLQSQELSPSHCTESKDLLNILMVLLRKHFSTFKDHPRSFFQTVVNEGGPVLSPMASSMLQNKYREIPYMEFVNKHMQQGAEEKNEKEAAHTIVVQFAFSPSGETIYALSFHNLRFTVTGWNVSSSEWTAGKEVEISPCYNSDHLLAVVKGGVLIVRTTRTLEMWNFELSKCIWCWTNSVTGVFTVSEERVACTTTERKVIILDTTSGEILSTIEIGQNTGFLACNSKFQILSWGKHDSLRLSDHETTLWEKQLPGIESGRFCPSERFVISIAEEISETKIYVLDAFSGKTLHVLVSTMSFSECEFVSDEVCVGVCMIDLEPRVVQLFNVKSGDLLSNLPLSKMRRNPCFGASAASRCKGLVAISPSDSEHGFELIQVRLPKDEESRTSKCSKASGQSKSYRPNITCIIIH